MLTAIQQPFFVVVFILLGICMIACLIAAIRGPELGDRIVAANMIGIKKRVIIVNIGLVDVVMFNPVIVSKHDMYETEEGCLSLDGVRKTTRYQEIEVEYYDFNWKKKRQKLSGWTAQICQHEIDHLSGKII